MWARSPLLAGLGGHDHHAVGTTATVDGCGRGVFQNFCAGYVAGRQEGDVVGDHSVHHIYRRCPVHGSDTADAHLGTRAGTARKRIDRHAGCLTLKGVGQRCGRRFLKIFGGDRAYRTGHVALFHSTVTYHDHFVKSLRAGKLHVITLCGVEFLPLLVESHIAVFHGLAGLQTDAVITVQIRHNSVGRILYHANRSSYKSLAVVGRCHRSCHGHLCRCRQTS